MTTTQAIDRARTAIGVNLSHANPKLVERIGAELLETYADGINAHKRVMPTYWFKAASEDEERIRADAAKLRGEVDAPR